MKTCILIQTCDKYTHLWEGLQLSYHFNWCWDLELPIYVLTEEKIFSNDKNIEKLEENECPSITQGIRTKEFWILFIMCISSSTPGLYVFTSYKNYGSQNIHDDEFLAAVGSAGSICNACFRFIWGKLMDKTSFRFTMYILVSIQTVLISTIYFISGAKVLYFVWICLILCCEGGNFSIFPTIIAKMYGKR